MTEEQAGGFVSGCVWLPLLALWFGLVLCGGVLLAGYVVAVFVLALGVS